MLDGRRFLHFSDPAFSPVRDLSWHTELEEVVRVARLMGWELMPWQRHVVEIATEYRLGPDGARHYRYHDVIVSVPRQCGKTTVVFPIMLHRLMSRERQSAFFTAQTGAAARQRIKDFVERATDPKMCHLSGFLKSHMEAGGEGLSVLSNRSKVKRFSPTPHALHGESPDLVVVDEFWSFSALDGSNLTGAIAPGQITKRSKTQTWWISTMGTEDSAFMNGMVESGRRSDDPTTAYFEWSLPEGADPEDPESWRFHPAVGNTITRQDLADTFTKLKSEDKLGEWLRAYMNRKTGTANPLISDSAWAAMKLGEWVRPDEFTLSYEAGPNNALAAVVASWRDSGGFAHTYVLRQAPGTAWVPHYVAWCWEHLKPSVISADDGGPTRRLTEIIRSRYPKLEVVTLSMPEFGSACMGWLEAARDTGTLRHDGSEALTVAVGATATRSLNGVERFSRDESSKPIPTVIASACSLWAWDNRRPEKSLQFFG